MNRSPTLQSLAASITDAPVEYETIGALDRGAYHLSLVTYRGDEEDTIPAYLLVPDSPGPHPAVLIHHQHNGERHLGKSEVVGIAGDPMQAFAPALAAAGFVVLAPDSICFEDRRANRTGILPDANPEADWLQHLNQMAYRLLRGDLLMRKILSDASRAVSLLARHVAVDPDRIGLLGHSYGGNTVIFQAAFDRRIAFACSSGAVCSFRQKFSDGTGIEFALIVPGLAHELDLPELLARVAPRRLLVVSATDDKYSRDADDVVRNAMRLASRKGMRKWLEHLRYRGGHEITEERFGEIVRWMVREGRRDRRGG
jgi:dienelactone hydrolase